MIRYYFIKISIAISILFVFLIPSNLYAQSQENQNRTFSALTLESSYLQQRTRGDLDFFTAVDFRKDWQTALSNLQGNRLRWGILRFDYYPAERVALRLRGAIQQTLYKNKNSDNISWQKYGEKISDVSDFSIAAIAILYENKKSRIGLRIETKLPNTNQDESLGANTIDLDMAILISQQTGALLFFSDLGVRIISAPLEINVQNDVLIYGFGAIWKVNNKLKLASEINGFASTHNIIPLGTKNRSIFRLGLVWDISPFSIEIFPEYGLTNRDGTYGVSIGISKSLNIL